MLKITSRENARLKLARKVRDGLAKDLIFVEGLRLAEEVLRSEIEINEVLVSASTLQTILFPQKFLPVNFLKLPLRNRVKHDWSSLMVMGRSILQFASYF